MVVVTRDQLQIEVRRAVYETSDDRVPFAARDASTAASRPADGPDQLLRARGDPGQRAPKVEPELLLFAGGIADAARRGQPRELLVAQSRRGSVSSPGPRARFWPWAPTATLTTDVTSDNACPAVSTANPSSTSLPMR